jgi:hypothetical protein
MTLRGRGPRRVLAHTDTRANDEDHDGGQQRGHEGDE